MSSIEAAAGLQQRQQDKLGMSINCNIWGEQLSKKSDHNIRLIFQNIRGFGTEKEDSKAEHIRQFINEHEVDIMAMSEMNVNWRLVGKKNTMEDITQSWFEHQRVTTAYNQKDRTCDKYQPGGTSLISRGEMALRVMGSGEDTRKIGRWSWQLLRGKDNIKLRIISVYFPCTTRSEGFKTVVLQQQKALLQQNQKGSVYENFWKDLWKEVDRWVEDGEQIVIGGDWNIDVRKSLFQSEFRKRNLIPAIIDKHGNQAPATYNRGRNPIDEIFVSSTLKVAGCGYLEHGQGLADHRPIWIDITKVSALGAKLPDLPTYKARRLKCRDPRIVNKYNHELEKYLRERKIFTRLHNLFNTFTAPLNDAHMKELEKIDYIREEGMLFAEKRCRKLKMGGVQWSPEIQKAMDTIRYIKLCITRKKNRKVGARVLIRMSKKAGVYLEHANLEELSRNLNKAYNEYKKLKKENQGLRKKYLEDLAEAMEHAGKGQRAVNLRNLITLENQRKMYRKLRRITRTVENLGTTFITIPGPENSKIDITEKEAMEEEIIKENRKKYHQTENTCPFLHSPLVDDFGMYGELEAAHKVSNGEYEIPEHIDEYTKDYLKVCSSTNLDVVTSLTRSPIDYKNSWKKMKEKTSSRQLHFGHFKAATLNPLNIMTHYMMAEIPFRSGYALRRWKTAINVMILKDAGNHNIEKLRTIVLYEADFNHNNKFFGRAMMQHTVPRGRIAKEQYSIPGRKSIDHALNRRLLFDISRYQKSSSAMTPCDLRSCYDRVVHTPAMLAMLGYGIPEEPMLSMFHAIQHMKYVTRTQFGDSKKTYGGLEPGFIARPQGLGQGNGTGPPVWSVVSSRMFEVLHKRGLVTSFNTPISQNKIDLCGFAFVDDTDIVADSRGTNDPNDTISAMQLRIDCWEGVAKATGGALAPDKSWWYLTHFEWDKSGRWRYGGIDNLEIGKLSARDKDNDRVELKYLPPSEAKKMLGVYLAPDGNNDQQVIKMKEKAHKMAEYVRVGHINKGEAWTALTTMAMKSLEYPLPALTLSESECKEIMWILLNSFLPKAGINRNIKRDVLYGPIAYQGLGLKDMYLTQGIAHVCDIVEHSWKSTISGHFIEMCLEQLRLEIGRNVPILSSDYNKFIPTNLTRSWIQSTWKFMSDNNIKMEDKTPFMPKQREGDQEIMEIFGKHQHLHNVLWQLNRCRIYLRAFHLSDIVEANGRAITVAAWTVQRTSSCHGNSAKWPEWGRPSKDDIKTWQMTLHELFCPYQERRLARVLGLWLTPAPPHWEWFIKEDKQQLLRRTENHWESYERKKSATRTLNFKCHPSITQSLQPIKMRRTTVEILHGHLHSHGISVPLTVSDMDESSVSSTEVETYKEWLYHSSNRSKTISKLVRDIKNGKARAVSDGSYKQEWELGTAAWRIESEDESEYIQGTAISPGPPELQSAYRSELLGLLAIMDRIKLLKIGKGRITIGCDGISALEKGTETIIASCSPQHKHSDLISAMAKIRDNLEVTFRSVHVRGHQDDKKEYEDLDRLAQINVDMDLAAKTLLDKVNQDRALVFTAFQSHPDSLPLISVHGKIVCHEVKNSIYNIIAEKKIIEHWIDKGRFTKIGNSIIDWRANARAMKLSHGGRKRFVTKWGNEWLGTGKNMKRWKLRHHGYCPFCLKEEENTNHILSCQHKDATTIWNKELWNYIVEMKKIGTCTTAILAIKRELIHWRLEEEFPDITELPISIRAPIRLQRKLGWRAFLDGLISMEWKVYMTEYYGEIKSKKGASLWASKAIRKGWDLNSAIWKGRNEQLHETARIEDMQGKTELIEVIKKEYRIGLSALPAYGFSHMFKIIQKVLFEKSVESMRDWLTVIRQGRILYKDRNRVKDDFDMKGSALKNWLGTEELNTNK